MLWVTQPHSTSRLKEIVRMDRLILRCAMDPLKRIVELLGDSPRKRIAAAVVLGELKVKDAGVIARLCEMARDFVDGYAEAAVEALGALGAMKGLPVRIEALGRGPAAAGLEGDRRAR